MKTYLYLWITLFLIALALLVKNRNSLDIFRKAYLRFLFKPWKLITFFLAGAIMIIAAPYSGDFTWDSIDASVMSVLTYLTAPWATGTLYRFFQRKSSLTHAYVAFCVAMFSLSWFYDGYILLRDGIYPPTWFSNIVLSSILYFAAGALWSIETPQDQKVAFAFQRDTWPEHDIESEFSRVFGYAFIFIMLGGFMIGIFVVDYFFKLF